MRLEDVLQRLYDSEINITLVTLWDGGFDFAFVSYMAWPEIDTPIRRPAIVHRSEAGAGRAVALAQLRKSQ